MANIPQATVQHYRDVLRLQKRCVTAAAYLWGHVAPNAISETWDEALPTLVANVKRAQREAVITGVSYTAKTLAQQGTYVLPDYFVNVDALTESAPNGGAVEDLLYIPVIRAKQAILAGVEPPVAVRQAGQVLTGMVSTLIADSARQSAGVDIVARPKVGYVRMLNPPSCARCVILAGKFFRSNTGFQRHPRCDCVHLPTRVGSVQAARAEGLIDDPYEYFDSLTEKEQDRVFGKAYARAVRDGADIYQVVNSKRNRVLNGLGTTEGMTRRGYAYKIGAVNRELTSRAGRVSKTVQGVRPTPEWIYANTSSRQQAISMLERYGYILSGGRNPLGGIRGQIDDSGHFSRSVQQAANGTLAVREAILVAEKAKADWLKLQEAKRVSDQLEAVRVEQTYRDQILQGSGRAAVANVVRVSAKNAGRKAKKTAGSGVVNAEKNGLVAGVSGGGRKPPRVPPIAGAYDEGRIPNYDPNNLPFDTSDSLLLEKIYYGIKGKTVGGHGWGQTPIGKASVNHEFPKEWDISKVEIALRETLLYGDKSEFNGAVEISHEIDGVQLKLRYYENGVDDVISTVAFHPTEGKGVATVRTVNGKLQRKVLRK